MTSRLSLRLPKIWFSSAGRDSATTPAPGICWPQPADRGNARRCFPDGLCRRAGIARRGRLYGCGDLFDRLRRTLCRTRRQCLSGAFPPLRPRYAHRYDFRKADVRCVGRFADRPAAAGTLQPGHYGFRGSLLSSGTALLYGVPFARPRCLAFAAVRSMSVPSNRGVRLSNPAISTTCTSNAAMNWYCADGVPATFGRGCTNFRSSKLPNLWNIRCWPRCRSFALSSKMPGRYALPGPSRCPCISFRTGRSTLFSTGSSWSAGRPPCAKCSLFRVKSSAITPFPVLRSVIYPADSSFVRLRHTVCRLNQSKTYTKK